MPSKPVPTTRTPGRKPTHAARMLARLWRENRLDKRTGPFKAIQAQANSYADRWGGWENLDALDESLIQSAAFLRTICTTIETFSLRGREIIDGGGALLPVLAKNYVTYQQALVRTLDSLERRDRSARQPIDLGTYLASHSGGHDVADATTDTADDTTAEASDEGRHEALAAPGDVLSDATDVTPDHAHPAAAETTEADEDEA